jgi:uncharacterized protein (DUF3084 family)
VLRLDEKLYSDDREMERIVHRLTMAAADAEMRHRMDVEDEYFSIIEKRDTDIMIKDKQIAEKNVEIAEKNVEIAKKSKLLEEKNGQIAEKDEQIAEKDEQIAEKDGQIAEKDEMLRKSIQMFLKTGMQIDEIAANLNKDPEDLRKLLSL